MNRWEVYQVFFEGTDGRTPAEQSADKAAQPTISQLDYLRPQPTGVASLNYIIPGTAFYTQPSTGLRRSVHDVTGSVSTQVGALTSGQHQAAVLYFDTETGATDVATATAVTAGGTLPSRGEFYEFTFAAITIPAYCKPLANVYLHYGQTALTSDDYYRFYDPRELFPASRDAYAILTTTDATTTTITSIAVAELSAITITGEYVATLDDYSAAAGGTFRYTVRRASGGSVTQIAAATISQDDDSSSSPAISLDVDTGTETARIRATGVSSETWYWRVRYTITRM